MRGAAATLACVAILGVVSLGAGCATDPGVAPGVDAGGLPPRGTGESCTASEDCASTLCVEVGPVGSARAVCTESCDTDADCPAAGWACVQPDRFESRICGCHETGRENCGNGVDDDCNGRADDCRVCGGVPVPENDRANCGACGHACRADQECHDGACRCTAATSMECGGSCIDVSVSTLHCGSCTSTCSASQICTHGVCGCGGGATACGSSCIDTQNDDTHCGSCGHACQDTQYCLAGVCTCPFAGGLCGGLCVDTATAPTDCGSCGHACRADQRCAASTCSCSAPRMDCGGACIDTRTSATNCGSCGHACAPGETCSGGGCDCASGVTCGGTCLPSNDAMNCGACGRVCSSVQTCAGGSCICPIFGQSYCMTSDTCVALQSDATNCGTCGRVCDPATVCASGACVCPTAGQSLCAGAGCVAFATDPLHCGSCTTACAPNQICSASRCSCPATLPSLCPTVGCVNEASDPLNCGACGNACRSGESCVSYSCQCSLVSQRWCAAPGTCIDVQSDPSNCGSCGNVCPGAATCIAGTCRCNTAGQTACDTSCVDLTTDAMHCGSCARVCTGSQICAGSTCTCLPPPPSMEHRLTSAANASDGPAMAWNGTNALVVWIDRRTTSGTVYSMLLAPDGSAGIELAVSSGPAGTSVTVVDVAWNGTEFAVAYGSGTNVTVVRLAADGTLLPFSSTFSLAATVLSDGIRLGYTSMLGYFVVASTSSYVDFVDVGTIGSAARPAIHLLTTNAQFDIATNGAGQVGVLLANNFTYTLMLQMVNADGSVTTSPTTINIGAGTAREPALAYDGTTWVAAWRGYTTTTSALVVARGTTLSAQTTAVGNPSSTSLMRRPSLVVGTGEVLVSWQARTTTTDTVWRIDGRRFAIPASSSAAVTALEAVRTYQPTTSVADQTHPSVLVSAGLLLGWADTRWGATEIYDLLIGVPPCAM